MRDGNAFAFFAASALACVAAVLLGFLFHIGWSLW